MKHFFILIFLVFILTFVGLFIYNHRDSGMSGIFPKPIQQVKESPSSPHVMTSGGNSTEQKKIVSVKLNEKVAFNSTDFEVKKVIEDSRCPSDVQCIQAGRIVVDINGVSVEEGKAVVVSNVWVTLTKATPYPVSTTPTNNYRFSLTFNLFE